MEHAPFNLTLDCLLSIFSFLEEKDLLRVSTVCQDWHNAAETPWLWREKCLQRWGFCNLGQLLPHSENCTWKNYYQHRSKLELNMKSGGTGGDYSCKTLRGHTGRIVGFSYLVSNGSLQDIWTRSPVICSASTDGSVKAWDIHKGVNLWSSSAQNPLTGIVTDPRQSVVITSDSTGVIQTWQGGSGEPLTSFSSGFSYLTLQTFSREGHAYLMMGTSLGLLVVLNSPALSEISRHVICDSFRLNILLSSPDDNWILTATKESTDPNPKVFWSQSVCCPTDDDETLAVSLPISGCRAAAFLPSQSSRVAVIHQNTLSVFDLTLKKSKYKQEPLAQQVDSFTLELNTQNSDVILQAKGNNTLLLADGNDLRVYTLKGNLITSFKDHLQPIVSLCVDNFRVVTASQDLSLRVLTWKNERDKGLTLESQYHLLGGSHTMSRGFTGVACDYASIVASVESVDGKDALKAYVFNS